MITKHTLSIIMIVLVSQVALSGGRYSELLLSLPEKRSFEYHEEKDTNSIVIKFHRTHVDEIAGLERYDEAVIPKVIVRSLRSSGSSVQIFLKDRKLRVTINAFSDPFRVRVAIFDRDYSLQIDPVTKLPKASIGSGSYGQDEVANASRSMNQLNNTEQINVVEDKTSYRLMRPSPGVTFWKRSFRKDE